MTAPLLEVESLTGFYGPIVGIRDASLRLDSGSAIGVVGPNGAGKSTLLKAVAGHLRSTGHVRLDGQAIDGMSAPRRYRRGLALVPQESANVDGLSVKENLRLSWLAGRRSTPFRKRVEMVVETFPQLADRLDVPSANLSGGQRQMLAISRGLSLDPIVLLLDEPTAGLSPRLTAELADALRGIRAEASIGIVLVEQNAAVAKHVCDAITSVAGGEIVWNGSPAELTAEAVAGLYFEGRAPGEATAPVP